MIRLLTSGIQTSIQDMGRRGFRKYGVPISGAMDQRNAQLANHLVQNEPQLPLIEFFLNGPILAFDKDALIAITGGNFEPKIDGSEIPLNTPINIRSGQQLFLGRSTVGAYGYLAIRGGIKAEEVLGSYSQYAGITDVGKLKKGDLIEYYLHETIQKDSRSSVRTNFILKNSVMVFEGPEYNLLNADMKMILASTFTLSLDVSRMGYRTEVKEGLSAPGIQTASVQPGTVQLTPDGQLIILMRDAQTTGGYARVLQLSPEAINALAQFKSGTSFRFDLIDQF